MRLWIFFFLFLNNESGKKKVLILGSNIMSSLFTVTNSHGDKWSFKDKEKLPEYVFHFNMAHITSSVYSEVIQVGSMGGAHCGSILLKCLCACIIHSAASLSYENIMAIKWDCGILPLHCLSPRGRAVVWELPSWTQTCQKWSLISDNIRAECIRNEH